MFRDPVIATFLVIPILLILLFGWAVATSISPRAGANAIAYGFLWMLATAALAESGILRAWNSTPPPFMVLLVVIALIAMSLAWSSVGRRIVTQVPLWALIAVQAFRLPLEIAMHKLVALNIMPEQMTYTGRNFDILSGATAIAVAAIVAARRNARALVVGWNLMGFALLANILVIAIVSTPRFAYFGPDRLNVFVTYLPFVWLPAVMVLSALLGHLLIFRALRVLHNNGVRHRTGLNGDVGDEHAVRTNAERS